MSVYVQVDCSQLRLIANHPSANQSHHAIGLQSNPNRPADNQLQLALQTSTDDQTSADASTSRVAGDDRMCISLQVDCSQPALLTGILAKKESTHSSPDLEFDQLKLPLIQWHLEMFLIHLGFMALSLRSNHTDEDKTTISNK